MSVTQVYHTRYYDTEGNQIDPPAPRRIIDMTEDDLRAIIRDEVARIADDTPEWMSYEQAAEYADKKIQTIRNWAAQGVVDKRGRGRGARVSRKSIEEYLGVRGGFYGDSK